MLQSLHFATVEESFNIGMDLPKCGHTLVERWSYVCSNMGGADQLHMQQYRARTNRGCL